MAALSDIVRHPSRAFRHATNRFTPSPPKSSFGPMKIGGALCLILTVVGVIWLWPEIQRYLRIERM